jgi:hypothetical protein
MFSLRFSAPASLTKVPSPRLHTGACDLARNRPFVCHGATAFAALASPPDQRAGAQGAAGQDAGGGRPSTLAFQRRWAGKKLPVFGNSFPFSFH